MHDPNTAPTLFNDALGSMQVALEDPSTDVQSAFQHRFNLFITTLAYEVDHERTWARSERGSVTLSTIISHPVWAAAGRAIVGLPPGEHTTKAQKCMGTLDRIREHVSPERIPVEVSELSHEALASQGEHITIDVGPLKHDVDQAVSDEALLEVDTRADEDKEASAPGPQTFPKDGLLISTTSTLFVLPTPPTDSPTSPPSPLPL